MFRTNKFTAHLLAASAAGLLGAGLIGQVFAQEEESEAPAAAQQNADEQPQDDAAVPVPQENAPQDNAPPSDVPQNDAANDAPVADDAAPADDLEIDDQGRADESDPPAIPSEERFPDDRRDDNRKDVDDRVSPSDRTRVRGDVRNDVRRFDYDDPSQPIPEQQAHVYQDNGCHPCAPRRVYYNSCGGCGHSYGYNQGGWNGGWSGGQPMYQTQSQQPNRPVLGITIRDDQDGVHVASVTPNSPAAKAGVRSGDRIVAIGGQDLRDSQGLMNHVRGMKSGDPIAITIDRDGEQQDVSANLGNYAQVFGNNRGRSAVPEPPQDRFAQRGEPRTALRPSYEKAASDQQRLDRVQQRIDQLERELTALRAQEQELQQSAGESKTAEPPLADDSIDAGETKPEEATPPADLPAPADEGDASNVDDPSDSDASDDLDATDETDADADTDEASPPNNRERLSPSAR